MKLLACGAWVALVAAVGCAPRGTPPGGGAAGADRRLGELRISLAERVRDAAAKVARLRAFLAAEGYDVAVVSKARGVNWLSSGGLEDLHWTPRQPPFRLVITSTAKYLIAGEDDAARILDTRLGGQGYEARVSAAHGGQERSLAPLLRGRRVVSDVPLASRSRVLDAYAELLFPLTPLDLRRCRWLGRKTALALEKVARLVEPRTTGRQAASLLRRELSRCHVAGTLWRTPAHGQVAASGRPGGVGPAVVAHARLEAHASRWGLVVAASRTVSFGANAELEAAFRKLAVVAARVWHATRPGHSYSEVLAAARRAYADAGCASAWQRCEPGGPIAFSPRAAGVSSEDRTPVRAGMAFTWSPALGGARITDTLVVTNAGPEVLTPCIEWPSIAVRIGGTTYRVPGILIR